MLLIRCPYCEMDRPELEFAHGGEAHVVRPENTAAADDVAWSEFLYFRRNTKGLYAERWRHVHGCGRFFNAVRDTVSDAFTATYRSGEAQP